MLIHYRYLLPYCGEQLYSSEYMCGACCRRTWCAACRPTAARTSRRRCACRCSCARAARPASRTPSTTRRPRTRPARRTPRATPRKVSRRPPRPVPPVAPVAPCTTVMSVCTGNMLHICVQYQIAVDIPQSLCFFIVHVRNPGRGTLLSIRNDPTSQISLYLYGILESALRSLFSMFLICCGQS